MKAKIKGQNKYEGNLMASMFRSNLGCHMVLDNNNIREQVINISGVHCWNGVLFFVGKRKTRGQTGGSPLPEKGII